MEGMGANPREAMLNNKYETKLRRCQQTARDECSLIRRDGEGSEPARGAGHGSQGVCGAHEEGRWRSWLWLWREPTLDDASCMAPSVLVMVAMAVTKHHGQKASWGEKGLFGVHFHVAVRH